MLKENPFHWVTIPVSDMDRAVAFYGKVFDMKLEPQAFGDGVMAFLPGAPESHGATGMLWKGEGGARPGEDGPTVFFGFAGGFGEALDRVEAAGGSVIEGRTPIGPYGFVAHVRDSEGNRIGFHGMD